MIDSAAASPLTHSPAGSGNVLLENLSATQMLTLTPTVTGGTQLLSISLAAGSIHAAAGGIVISANLSRITLTKTGTNSHAGCVIISASSLHFQH